MLTSNAFYTLFSFDARIKSSIVNSLSVTLNSPCDKNILKNNNKENIQVNNSYL